MSPAPQDHDPLLPQHAVQISAGGVVCDNGAGGLEVCLISKRKGRIWALPKGRLDPGETPEHAAVREVLEETGCDAVIVAPLGTIEYDFHWKSNNTNYHKVVSYFLMRARSRQAQPPDQEADEVSWITIDEACRRVTHENERDILRAARKRLDVRDE